MKRVLILHGTSSNSEKNWFPWLKKELESKSIEVWVPDLPHSEKPNIQRYNTFIFQNENWIYDEDTVIIGHSSGTLALLGLLEHLPQGKQIGLGILVAAFRDNLGREDLKELFLEEYNFELIKTKANKFIFIHSDNDPYCPLSGAKYLSDKLNGELIIKEGQGHFNTDNPEYIKFPFLLKLLEKLLL